jgi:ankyrin repeat protein
MQLPKLDEPSRVRASAAVSEWLEAARSGCVARLAAPGLDRARALAAAADSLGWTGLHYAAARDHTAALQWLIDVAGAPVDAKTASGCTALAVAAHRGHEACVSALLARGADSMAREKAGLVPLSHAAVSGSLGTVRALIHAGASVLRAGPNRDNSTPLGIAARVAATAMGAWQQAQSSAALKCIEAEAKRLHGWFRAVRARDAALVTKLLDEAHGASEGGAARGDMGLHSSGARREHIVDMLNGSGETALGMCMRSARIDAALVMCVRVLLRHGGADANRRDIARRTPLHQLATTAAVPDSAEASAALESLFAELLAAGARPLALDGAGRTPLQALGDYAAPSLVGATLRRADAHARHMRTWRVVGRVAGHLAVWHAGAVERVYAPGGAGFRAAEADFEERAAKSQRTG